jgi:hypothetical protein
MSSELRHHQLVIVPLAIGVVLDVFGSVVVWVAASIAEDLDFGTFWLAVILSVGLAHAAFAAFAAGCIAKINYLQHGLAVGVIGLAFAVFWGVSADDALPSWYGVALDAGFLPVSALGGYLAAGLRRLDER